MFFILTARSSTSSSDTNLQGIRTEGRSHTPETSRSKRANEKLWLLIASNSPWDLQSLTVLDFKLPVWKKSDKFVGNFISDVAL